MNYVGIDIAKRTHVAAVIDEIKLIVEQIIHMKEQVKKIDKKVKSIYKKLDNKLTTIPGINFRTAAAIIGEDCTTIILFHLSPKF